MLNEASELALVIMLGYVALCLSVCWAVKLTHLFFSSRSQLDTATAQEEPLL